LTNREGIALPYICLRAMANAYLTSDTAPAPIQKNGGAYISDLTVNGEYAAVSYLDEAKTVLYIHRELAENETVTISMRLRLSIPVCASRFGLHDGIYAVSNAFVLPAKYENGAYRQDEYSALGDPFYFECVNFNAEISLPEELTLACGAEITSEKHEAGMKTYSLYMPAARDLALAFSDKYSVSEDAFGNTLIRAYATSGNTAGEYVKNAKKALEVYSGLFGEYPYSVYSLAYVGLPDGCDGADNPALSFISDSSDIEITVAREAARQWWGCAVGSDRINNPWQNAALSEFSALLFTEKVHGKDAMQELYNDTVGASYRLTLPRNATPGSPLNFFSDLYEYRIVVYNRGAAVFTDLYSAVGDDLTYALSSYYENERFRLAGRDTITGYLSIAAGYDYAPMMVDYLDTYATVH
ncbi:MAG: hypothetical protein PHU22_02860, partial [Eubacteriales bacterium]|nr:hypothetical protein [Eubacteriales bacterium]